VDIYATVGIEGAQIEPSVVEDIAEHLTQLADPLGCPASPPKMPASPGHLTRPLPDDVRVAVACRYAGLNEAVPAETLTSRALLEDARHLVAAVNAARPPADGTWYCPPDSAGIDLLVFTGPVSGTTTAAVARSGCRWTTTSLGTTSLTPDTVEDALSALDAPSAQIAPTPADQPQPSRR
jgi:hypothetical protein